MHSGSRRSERESDTGFLRIYMQWKVRVVSPSFKRLADSEQSLWQSLKTNAEDEHKVNGYEREEKEKYRLRIASERDDDDDYHDVSDEHNSNKRLCPSILMGGLNGCEEWSLSSGLDIYGQRIKIIMQ